MNESIVSSSMDYSKKVILIINPVSGKKQMLRYIPQVIRCFMDAGYIVTTCLLYTSPSPRD